MLTSDSLFFFLKKNTTNIRLWLWLLDWEAILNHHAVPGQRTPPGAYEGSFELGEYCERNPRSGGTNRKTVADVRFLLIQTFDDLSYDWDDPVSKLNHQPTIVPYMQENKPNQRNHFSRNRPTETLSKHLNRNPRLMDHSRSTSTPCAPPTTSPPAAPAPSSASLPPASAP